MCFINRCCYGNSFGWRHKYYYIKARKGAKLYLGMGSNVSATGSAIHMIYYRFFLRILDKFWSNDLDLSSRKVKII